MYLVRKKNYPMFSNPFRSFLHTLRSLWNSLRLTGRHLRQALGAAPKSRPISHAAYFQTGPATLQYPHEQLPVPPHGRYQLHNEIDDCIVCDKCARVCPVDCIEIESVQSPVPLGKTSNGMTKRLYAARFDIDMAKCCFCGLCTTVCPTECLTMTPQYDYSVFDWAEHKVSFATAPPAAMASQSQVQPAQA